MPTPAPIAPSDLTYIEVATLRFIREQYRLYRNSTGSPRYRFSFDEIMTAISSGWTALFGDLAEPTRETFKATLLRFGSAGLVRGRGVRFELTPVGHVWQP